MPSRASSVIRTLSVLVWTGASALLAQNLVSDGGFATSLDAWHHDPNDNGTSAWSDQDASGSASSGSALLTSTHATTGVLVSLMDQCVPVAAGQTYALSANVRFSEGETTTGWAETVIYWESGPICNTYISGNALLTDVGSRGTWISDSDTFIAPSGATSAFVHLGIDKLEAGGVLSARFDNIVFAPVGTPTESLVGILPVAGSLPGSFGSFFRTSVTLLNPGFSPISGRLVFHPAGTSGAPSDPDLGYSLAPGQSFALNDVVAAMGRDGLGSIDVYGAGGDAPVVLARIFNDAGAAGTSGFTEPLISPSDVTGGPGVSVTGVLVCPADLSRYRYNVGLRTLGAPVHVSVSVLDSSGAIVHTASHDYPANYFVQTTVSEFLDGFSIGDAHSLRITFSGGGLIVYGATVDNTTNDPSAQFMPYLFAIA
jgi:hypothetical protein